MNNSQNSTGNDDGVLLEGSMSPSVLVLGAGVAGLTAAHELAERGFKVTVVEHAADPRPSYRLPALSDDDDPGRRRRRRRKNPDGTPEASESAPLPAVGGMARTQWAWLPPRPRVDVFQPLLRVPDQPDGWRIPIDVTGDEPRGWLKALGTGDLAPGLGRHLDGFASWNLKRTLRKNRWFGVRRHFLLRGIGREYAKVEQGSSVAVALELMAPKGSLRKDDQAAGPKTVSEVLDEIRDQGLAAANVVGSRPELLVEGAVSRKEWAAFKLVLSGCEDGEESALHLVAGELLEHGAWDAEKCGRVAQWRGGQARRGLSRVSKNPPGVGADAVAELVTQLKAGYAEQPKKLRRALCRTLGYSRACRAAERLVSLGASEGDPVEKVITAAEKDLRAARDGIWVEPVSGGLTDDGGIVVRPMGQLVPGEHGYRFFPAFYRNLLDMLGRIRIYDQAPLSDEQEAANKNVLRIREGTSLGRLRIPFPTRVPSGRTVRENLVSVRSTSFAFPDRRTAKLNRLRPTSIKEVLENLGILLDGLGWKMGEVALFQLKVLEYATTCTARRVELEEVSWSEFLCQTGRAGDGIDDIGFSDAFLEQLERWPRALIGLDAREGDARTFGSILLQLVFDTLRDEGFVDGTLNGPTSEAWFDPWVEDLARGLNVEFVRDTVSGICWDEPSGKITVKTEGICRGNWKPYWRAGIIQRSQTQDPDEVVEAPTALQIGEAEKGLSYDYLVLALSPGALRGLLPEGKPFEALVSAVAKSTRDLKKSAGDLEQSTRDLESSTSDLVPSPKEIRRNLNSTTPSKNHVLGAVNPAGPLRNFSGIQLFFSNETRLDPGHVYYPETRWGLSSISQIQFRTARPEYGGFGGSLSIVLGQMHEGATALWPDSTRHIAEKIWGEVEPTIDGRDSSSFNPAWIWLDAELHRAGPDSAIEYNASPYFVNLKGEWSQRPGIETWKQGGHRYPVIRDRVVVCGQLSPTHTRLGTMEASCESARHAVNALLRTHAIPPIEKPLSWDAREWQATRASSRPCQVWNPEDFEVRDLDWMKQLDERLHQRDVPHPFQALRIYDLVSLWFPKSDDSRDHDDVKRKQLVDGLADLASRRSDVASTLAELEKTARSFGTGDALVAKLFAPLRDYFSR